MKKLFALTILVLSLAACGGHTPVKSDPFVPASPLTCTGKPEEFGQLCDFSDGKGFTRHDMFSVSYLPNGHGTFSITTEFGKRTTGLDQVQFKFPKPIELREIHGSLTVTGWCAGVGEVTGWDSFGNGISRLTGWKGGQLHVGDTSSFQLDQVGFYPSIYTEALNYEAYTDLCAVATYNWVLNGSFDYSKE